MGRKSKGHSFCSYMMINGLITRYCINSSKPKACTLNPPLTRDEFHKMLKQKKKSTTDQTSDEEQQTHMDIHSATGQSSGEVINLREEVLNKPDFETRQLEPYETRFRSKPAIFYESFDSDDEDDFFLEFDSNKIMENYSVLDGSIETYDPTALFTRNYAEH